MKRILIAAIAAVALAGQAFATDLGPVQVQEPSASWTGVYVGVGAGLGAVTLDPSLAPLGGDHKFIEGRVGYDQEVGKDLLFGIFGGASHMDIDGGPIAAGIDLDTTSYEVGGRVGMIVGSGRDTLLYAGGGHRWTETDPFAGLSVETSGMFALAGIEHRITDAISVSLEGQKYFGEVDKPATGATKVELDDTRVRLGLNYRLSFGS